MDVDKDYGIYDFSISIGQNFERTFTWFEEDGTAPINITGYSAEWTFRRSLTETSTEDFTLFSGVGGNITLGGSLGTIALAIDDSVTVTKYANYYHELTMISASGNRKPLLKGVLEME